MKFLTEEPLAPYFFLFLALASYLLFMLTAIISRVGTGRQPMGRFNRLHFRSTMVYITASLGFIIFNWHRCAIITAGDWLIGLFVYFGFHYAIVTNFFALAQASVSTAIISILHSRGGQTTRAGCMADYAGGEGFAYIKRVRLSRIQNLLGWVEVQDERYRLTRPGRWMVRVTRLMLRLWGLNQIGNKS